MITDRINTDGDRCRIQIRIDTERIAGKRDSMIFGQFLEHFHRQIYGGVYDPESRFADEQGFRSDVLEAMRRIKVPVIRWPGGCFASAFHWKDSVGQDRKPFFDKAWRVEDPAIFGTDEYIALCRKIGCEPYICSNAGTGNPEETSDWVEYCNLSAEGIYARERIRNGHPEPYRVRYWSIGNENYGDWEIGAKSSEEWCRYVLETAKMIRHVDPTVELSAAALTDLDWNVNLLKKCANYLDWISIHQYWDGLVEENSWADYEGVMAYTSHTEDSIRKVEGLLQAMGLDGKIKIAFDEWNLRSWYHPNVFHLPMGTTQEEYLEPRKENDRNETYTIADAVFSACFLNACLRHCRSVKMANFSPAVNTRGCIYTYEEGIVLRPTYHVFDLYVNLLGSEVLDAFCSCNEITVRNKNGMSEKIMAADSVVTRKEDGTVVMAIVNKDPEKEVKVELKLEQKPEKYRLHLLTAPRIDSYNDIDRDEIHPVHGEWKVYDGEPPVLPPHSVTILELH